MNILKRELVLKKESNFSEVRGVVHVVRRYVNDCRFV